MAAVQLFSCQTEFFSLSQKGSLPDQILDKLAD